MNVGIRYKKVKCWFCGSVSEQPYAKRVYCTKCGSCGNTIEVCSKGGEQRYANSLKTKALDRD